MANLEDLGKRIKVFEDIEAIKKLKVKYFHSIDRKRWDKLAECFSKDGIWESGRHQVKLEGVEAIVQFIKGQEGEDHIITTHQGHNPEIEITSDTTAKGMWALYYYKENIKEKIRRQSGAFYDDDYVKENGKWRIEYLRLIT
ncbi:unnamed protein product, partial [marine sediment metagenome]